eukprot:6748593-Pyramimonas_sp.AAC.1
MMPCGISQKLWARANLQDMGSRGAASSAAVRSRMRFNRTTWGSLTFRSGETGAHKRSILMLHLIDE